MPTPPDPIAQLTQLLAKLPGVGERSAQRLTFHILRSSPDYARELSEAIGRVIREVKLCSRCCNLTPVDPCAICGDTRRDDRTLCVVESVQDLLAVERTREFRGRYHVLHGALSPLDGVGPDDLKVQELLAQLQASAVEEVILATNPTVEGEATALYLARLMKPFGLRISRIAQGVPMGGDLEYADQVTLARAMAGRREL
jgi:recombination protein RecR